MATLTLPKWSALSKSFHPGQPILIQWRPSCPISSQRGQSRGKVARENGSNKWSSCGGMILRVVSIVTVYSPFIPFHQSLSDRGQQPTRGDVFQGDIQIFSVAELLHKKTRSIKYQKQLERGLSRRNVPVEPLSTS